MLLFDSGKAVSIPHVLLLRSGGRAARPGWLAFVTAASGLLIVATVMGGNGWPLAVFRQAEGMDPQIARMLFDQGNFAFANAWVMLTSLLLAAGIVSIRTGALPRWLGWAGVAIAGGARRLGELAACIYPVRLVRSLADRDQRRADPPRVRRGSTARRRA